MLDLPRLSSGEVQTRNALFRRRPALAIDIGGEERTIEFLPRPQELTPLIEVDVTLNGQPVTLAVDGDILAGLLDDSLTTTDLLKLPPELGSAVVATALETQLDGLSELLGGPVAIEALRAASADADPLPEPGRTRIDFRLAGEDGRAPIMGFAVLTQSALSTIAAGLERSPPAEDGWDALRVAGVVTVGRARLSIPELRDLEVGDVVLVDRSGLDDDTVEIRIDKQLILSARVEARSLEVLAVGGSTMQDNADEAVEAEPEEPQPASVDELGIELTFDLGTITVTLEELRGVAPGYSFDLDKGLDRPVAIRSNGQLIGKGELVQIDDRLGVRVVDLFRRDNG